MTSYPLPAVSSVLSDRSGDLPNFPLQLSIKFNTQIVRRQDGSENPYSDLTSYPNRRFRLSNLSINTEAQARKFDSILSSILGETEIIDWTTVFDIINQEVIDINTLRFTITDRSNKPIPPWSTIPIGYSITDSFLVNQEVVLLSDYRSYNARVAKAVITAKTATTLTLTISSSLINQYTRLAHKTNCFSNQFTGGQSTSRISNNQAEWVEKFGPKRLPNNSIDSSIDRIPYSIPFYYATNGIGFPIFSFRPDWSAQVPGVDLQIINREYGTNIIKFDTPEKAGHALWDCNYVGSRNYIRQIEYFIYSVYGSYSLFWFIPPIEQIKVTSINNVLQGTHYTSFSLSGSNDLIFTDNSLNFSIGERISYNSIDYTILAISNSGKTITLDKVNTGITYIQKYQATVNLPHPYNYITTYNGNAYLGIFDGIYYHIRKIITITNNPNNTSVLVLDSSLPDPTSIVFIGPAVLYRFSTDETIFTYLHTTLASVKLQFFEISLYNNNTLLDTTAFNLASTTLQTINPVSTLFVGFYCSRNCSLGHGAATPTTNYDLCINKTIDSSDNNDKITVVGGNPAIDSTHKSSFIFNLSTTATNPNVTFSHSISMRLQQSNSNTHAVELQLCKEIGTTKVLICTTGFQQGPVSPSWVTIQTYLTPAQVALLGGDYAHLTFHIIGSGGYSAASAVSWAQMTLPLPA